MSLPAAPSMSLSVLLQGFAGDAAEFDATVSGLSLDSRKVESGHAYIALQGTVTHGIQFAEAAIDKGAIAILIDADDAEGVARQKRLSVPVIQVPQLAQKLGEIASTFYAHPSQQVSVCGVTGTDGKTSVCRFITDALTQIGYQVGYIGTIGWGLASQLQPNPLTTPDAITLQSMMSTLYSQGAEFIILEVSSHALVQGRVNGVAFDVAVLTNLGRDHLDYHGDLVAYQEAKALLFSRQGLSAMVVNLGDEFGKALATQYAAKLPVTGIYNDPATPLESGALKSTVIAQQVSIDERGVSFTLTDNTDRYEINSPLLGHFNVDNLLSCYAVLRAFGIASETAAAQLHHIKPVAGRMERFGQANQAHFIVDFSHTPQALAAALQTLRAHCRAQLWVVFGCGGDRDPGKRDLMGGIAAMHADKVVITDDNPRSEPSQQIIDQILQGIPASCSPIVIADRESALAYVVQSAAVDDWVLVAGKGHEDYQIIGTQRLAFSDREALQRLTQSRAFGDSIGGRL